MASAPSLPGTSLTISRRQVLKLMAGTGLALLLEYPRLLLDRTAAIASQKASRWSDPDTWGGRVPGKHDKAVIGHKVILDVKAQVRSVLIKRGGQLIFDPHHKATLISTGNVIVRGRLTSQPKHPGAVHRLVFKGVKEANFKGGGMDVQASDVGLWVMDKGALRIAGSKKLSWTRAAGAVVAGADAITLAATPGGWKVGDAVVITPTLPPKDKNFQTSEERTITGVSGTTVTLSSPLQLGHPAVDGKTAEVLNLTRNVVIEGSPGGRAHVFIRSSAPQSIRNAELRNLGPQKAGQGVLGRYALHFHHSHHGSHGSVVDGVVVHDSGNRAFVPHASHGIKMTDCVAHRVSHDPFWWDIDHQSDDILWLRCVASEVYPVDESAHGFVLGRGAGVTVQDCVGVGVRGGRVASGFRWPTDPGNPNNWGFNGNVGHNCSSGASVWQNGGTEQHLVGNFVAYHNQYEGFDQGAYKNNYDHVGGRFYGNGDTGLTWHVAPPPDGLVFENGRIEGPGPAIATEKHAAPPQGVYVIRNSTLLRTTPGPKLVIRGDTQPDEVEVHDCGLTPVDVQIPLTAQPGTVVRIYEGGVLLYVVTPGA